jgi:hypothetical protein
LLLLGGWVGGGGGRGSGAKHQHESHVRRGASVCVLRPFPFFLPAPRPSWLSAADRCADGSGSQKRQLLTCSRQGKQLLTTYLRHSPPPHGRPLRFLRHTLRQLQVFERTGILERGHTTPLRVTHVATQEAGCVVKRSIDTPSSSRSATGRLQTLSPHSD